jgi:hypothetical protein
MGADQQRLVLETQSFDIRDVCVASQLAAHFFRAIPVPGGLPRINAVTLFLSKAASVLVGMIFRKVYPRGRG